MQTLESSLLYTREDGSQDFIHDTYGDFFLAIKYSELVRHNTKGVMERQRPSHLPRISSVAKDFIRELLGNDLLGGLTFSGKLPPYLSYDGKKYYSSIDGKEMVFVPDGLFIFDSQKRRSSSLHAWEILFSQKRLRGCYYIWETLDFFIDKYPVTNLEFSRFIEETKYKADPGWLSFFKKGQENHPAIIKKWPDAFEYAKWAKKRVLREDYWEKAARGVDGREYPWGDNFDPDKINCATKIKNGKPQLNVPIIYSMPVDAFPTGASPYGCIDMCGNAWELVVNFNSDGITYCGGSHLVADFVSHPYSRIDDLEFISPLDLYSFRLGIYVEPDKKNLIKNATNTRTNN